MSFTASVGQRFGGGRFEVTEWIGPDFLMGIAIARDHERDRRVRLTFAANVSRSVAELRPLLMRGIPGLAPVVYLDDERPPEWHGTTMLMAESLPDGAALAIESPASATTIAAFGARLAAHVARVHRSGTAIAMLRPESTFVTATGDIELVVRGERLWFMPRPNVMTAAMLPPWPYGYLAPELIMQPLLGELDPRAVAVDRAADVYSIGVMLAEWLLGRYVFTHDGITQLFTAQLRGDHEPLPDGPLGALLARCLRPDPRERPALDELQQALEHA